jgi:hypothetical protein
MFRDWLIAPSHLQLKEVVGVYGSGRHPLLHDDKLVLKNFEAWRKEQLALRGLEDKSK